jgi:DTW domain-containing protein YfiP
VVFACRSELNKITNTGVLAHRVLNNSALLVRGHKSRNTVTIEDFGVKPNSPLYVVYPQDNAQVLDEDFVKKLKNPLTLIFPDGHWGQTKKIIQHEATLKNLPRLKLPAGLLSHYRLRRNVTPGRVCTFEAILLALGILEGEAVRRELEKVFEKKVTRLLWLRGKIKKDEVR